MIEKVICHMKIHVMYNLIACVHEEYNKLLDFTDLAKAFLIFIIWVVGGDEISACLAKLVIQRSSLCNYH